MKKFWKVRSDTIISGDKLKEVVLDIEAIPAQVESFATFNVRLAKF